MFNSSVPSSACFWSFRMYFEYTLPEIFENLNHSFLKNAQNEENQAFFDKVMQLLKVWNEWVIFDNKFLFGLEALFNRKAVNGEYYDSSSPLGIKLKFLEEELKLQSRISLEKACKVNGLPIIGPNNKLIERLLVLEDYKFKTEKQDENKNSQGSSDSRAIQASGKTSNLIFNDKSRDNKSTTKIAINLLKNFRSIRHKNMNDCSISELDSYYKVYIDVLRLLQSRAEKFNISEADGMEFDEVDEYIFNIKKKLNILDDNLDGIFFFF